MVQWAVSGSSIPGDETASVRFSEPGTYNVSLTATDDDNETASYEVQVYVQENQSATDDESWTADDPTALGTCALPRDEGGVRSGLLVEYWDPSYSTVSLDTTLTYGGVSYDLTKTFDEPKGYYFGCVDVGRDVGPGPEADNATANTTVEYANGSTEAFNDTGISDVEPENSLGGSSGGFTFGGGGGPLIGEDAGAGAPTWLTALPALAAIAYVGYRRFQNDGGGGGGAPAGSRPGGSGGILGRLRGR